MNLNTERKLFELKGKLISKFMTEVGRPELFLPIQVVASDAFDQAAVSPLPLVVYPVLFEAKSEAVLKSYREKKKAAHQELSLAS